MAETLFDVLVIGGGINGSGVARDAAQRGLKVALIERNDFGWGTTARSTRLAHGGLRYLEMFDFALVRESLRERERLLRNAPHLVHPLPFLTPVYQESRRGPAMIKLGMALYDLLSYDKSLPRYRWYGREGLLQLEPGLAAEGLMGGALYYDAQIDYPERLCIENVLCAARSGALAANYVEMETVREAAGSNHMEVTVRDRITDEESRLRTRIVVNATGPWSDRLNLPGSETLRTTKGVHLLVPKMTDHAMVMLAQKDGRLFFSIPWRGYSLIGTTDTDFTGDPGEARADAHDLHYLVTETQHYFPNVPCEPIYLSMAGVRPLVRQEGSASESAVSRKHKMTDSHPGAACGVVSVMGGKLTNYRFVAEEVTDLLCKKLGLRKKCRTVSEPLFGGDIPSVEEAVDRMQRSYGKLGLPPETIPNLVQLYGSRTRAILDMCRANPELARPLDDDAPDILAQVAYGVSEEMVVESADLILRRSGVGLRPGRGRSAYARVSAYLGASMGWSAQDAARDRENFERQVDLLELPDTRKG